MCYRGPNGHWLVHFCIYLNFFIKLKNRITSILHRIGSFFWRRFWETGSQANWERTGHVSERSRRPTTFETCLLQTHRDYIAWLSNYWQYMPIVLSSLGCWYICVWNPVYSTVNVTIVNILGIHSCHPGEECRGYASLYIPHQTNSRTRYFREKENILQCGCHEKCPVR
jgi:hypothetical protein